MSVDYSVTTERLCRPKPMPPPMDTYLLASGQLSIIFHEAEVCLGKVASLLQPLLSEICTIDAATTGGGGVKVGLYDCRLVPKLEQHVYHTSSNAGLKVKAVEVVADPSAHLRVVAPPESVLHGYKAESEQALMDTLRSASEYYGDVRAVSKSPASVGEDLGRPLGQPPLLRHRSEGSVLPTALHDPHFHLPPGRYTVEFYDLRSAARMRKAMNFHSHSAPVLPSLPDTYSWAMTLYSRYGFRVVEPRDLEAVGNFGHRRRSPSCDEGRESLEIDLQKVKLGVDNRTAVMIRNVPRNYTQPMLFAELVEAIGNAGYNVFMIDYIYMPYDVRQKESSTYVFANVKEAAMIEALYGIFEGPSPLERVVQSVEDFVSLPSSADAAASTSVRYAKCHGLDAILNSLSRGAAQQLPACYRPLVAMSTPPTQTITRGSPVLLGTHDQTARQAPRPLPKRAKSARSVGDKTETRVSTEASKIDFALLPTPHLSRHAAGSGAPLLLFDSATSSTPTDSEGAKPRRRTPPTGCWSVHRPAVDSVSYESTRDEEEEQCLSTATEIAYHCLQED
ncbi:hypothetical protein FOZ63_004763 [Perkinsus olseni]|uniref:Mei2-like C-terminal RNA recognition motif domain-containing protein n=1 Tax=Perkinsus olseni TaxID=32597 RepID=A0A7J6PR54_PEROL|nr:hypothetical protein FOZ63_004763 [Perkinsus olseni]KAF4701956.1 hypothetical protein FOZ62_006306 [Perkinsus olseni]